MNSLRSGGLGVALVVGLAASASADPGFVTMDRFDGSSRAGGELSYLFPNDGGATNSVTSFRFDGHGEYIDPNSGFGGYVQLPLAHYSQGGQSATGIGDLEVGGVFIPKLGSPNATLVVHAGITLPTGSTSQDGEAANLIGLFTRLTDFYLAIPSGLSVRLGVSPIVHQGNLFARIDAGLDANISAANNGNVDSILRFNIGGGINLESFALMAEIVNLHNNGSGGGDQWINEGALSARFHAATVDPYVALVLPLDHDSHQIVNAAITVGAEGRLR